MALTVREAGPADVKAWLDKGEAVLIDVREGDEYAREHVPGSVLNPLSRFDVAALPEAKERRLVFLCRSGNRSLQAIGTLQGRHDGTVYNLMGGLMAWAKHDLPVTRDLKQPLPVMRQVQIAAGGLILIGALLGWLVDPLFFLICAFVGAGLTFAGITGFCGMARLLQVMPWNKAAAPATHSATSMP